ncbi:TolC family protein [bacterium]|nr:TolC family protein [bacterium]
MHRWYWHVLFLVFAIGPLGAQTQLTIADALEEAREKNPELLSSAEYAKAERLSLWSAILPANPEVFMEKEGIQEGTALSQWGERKIGIVQSFRFPTAYFFEGNRGSALSRMALARHIQNENNILARVKIVFMNVLATQKMMQLEEEMFKWAEINLEKSRIRVRSGETSVIDSLRARVLLTESQNSLMAATNTYHIQKAELNVLLGRSSEKEIIVKGELNPEISTVDYNRLRAKALAVNPVFLTQRSNTSVSKAEYALAWHDLLPEFSIKAFQRKFQFENLANDRGFEIGMTVPIWFFVKEQTQIRAAKARLNASNYDYTATEQSVLIDIKKIYSGLTLAEKTAQCFQAQSLAEAEELARITRLSYEAGESGYLEMIESFNTLARVKGQFIQAQLAVYQARARLEVAVGTSLFNW